MSDVRHLYLSRTNKVIAGVCGGLGEYLGIDPVILRIIFVVLFIFSGIGFVGYLIAWLVMPKQSVEVVSTSTPTVPATTQSSVSGGGYIFGTILILIGVYFLLDRHFWWWHIERYWPLLLVAAGVLLIVHYFHRNNARKEGINEPSQI